MQPASSWTWQHVRKHGCSLVCLLHDFFYNLYDLGKFVPFTLEKVIHKKRFFHLDHVFYGNLRSNCWKCIKIDYSQINRHLTCLELHFQLLFMYTVWTKQQYRPTNKRTVQLKLFTNNPLSPIHSCFPPFILSLRIGSLRHPRMSISLWLKRTVFTLAFVISLLTPSARKVEWISLIRKIFVFKTQCHFKKKVHWPPGKTGRRRGELVFTLF